MTRPWILSSLLAISALSACQGQTSPPQGKALRIVLISCDTLRADTTSAYGYPKATTPQLASFAAESTLYSSAYTTAPWTAPALAALMTGRLPDELGVHGGNRFALDPRAETLAEAARDAGYSTAAVVSNWVLRRPPAALGDAGLAQGFDHYDDTMTDREGQREAFERKATATTDAALSWLDSESARQGRFFLWVHYQDPHGPYAPPPEFAARFPAEGSGGPALPLGKNQSGKNQIPAYQVVGDQRSPASYRARYEAEIAYFDSELGRLFAGLRDRGWWEDTLIVFTADHGESLGENHYYFCHGENLQRETVQVPLIIRFPQTSARVVPEAVSHLDLWPTLREALGLEAQARRGISLYSAQLPLDRALPMQLGSPGSPKRHVGIVIAGHQYTLNPEGQPHSERWQSARSPDLEQLQALLRKEMEHRDGPDLRVLPLGNDARNQRALRQLGYTESEDHD